MTLRARFRTRNRFLAACLVLPGIPFAIATLIGAPQGGGPLWALFCVVLGLLAAVAWGFLMWNYFERRAARVGDRESSPHDDI
jgi:hypothetical protein